MTADLRLVVFDVDGTLVDSQHEIVAAMRAAFDGVDHPVPEHADVLGIVGLSLPQAVARLAPGLDPAQRERAVTLYKETYAANRARHGADAAPLYPGVRTVLEELHAVPHWLMGVATGKSRRGLDALIAAHGLDGRFLTQQVSDHHPSKPHPAMLEAALAETGLGAHQAVMVGDTEYDMAMARAAGLVAIGVSWGYHPRDRLAGADHIIDDIAALPPLLKEVWGET